MALYLSITTIGLIVAAIVYLWRKSNRHITKHCKDVVVIDFETTGLDASEHAVVQFAAVRVGRTGRIEKMSGLVNPMRSIPLAASKIHGIKQKHVKNAPAFDDVLPGLMQFIGDRTIAAYNAPFDMSFLEAGLGEKVQNNVIDVLEEARSALHGLHSYRLGVVAAALRINHNAHDATSDALAAMLVLGHIRARASYAA